MAKLVQPSLTAGELSPSMLGRTDLARYHVGLKRCRNFIVRPYGGVDNRAGLRFIAVAGPAATPETTGVARVIPFVFSTLTSYVLELGHHYMRFVSQGAEVAATAPAWAIGTTYALNAYVTAGGQRYRSLQAGNVGHDPQSSTGFWLADDGLQIWTPWSETEVFDLRYTQSADVMYLVHPGHPPQELRRTAANAFTLAAYAPKEGPFRDLNTDESLVVSANRTFGTVTLTSNSPIFTANAVGSLFYLETKNIGQIKPWLVGDRSVSYGTVRRSDGKTYKAVTVPAAGDWTETGNRQPIHEAGRAWDGAGDTRTNGAQTWSVGVEWEYVDSGYGIVRITGVAGDGLSATGVVEKMLPSQVVGGVGLPSVTWPLVGDGVTKTFAIAGAEPGKYAVTINGQNVQSDPNYYQPPPRGAPPGGDPYDEVLP